jgi:hypothetical protein
MCTRTTFLLACVLAAAYVAVARDEMESLGAQETWSAARLSAKESAEIIAAIRDSAFDTPESWKRELRARRVSLGSAPGLIVEGSNLLCGGTGNCQLWVLRKAGQKWVSLFGSDQAPLAESFRLGPTSTHGIKDLTVAANSGAEHVEVVTYRFDGKAYRASHAQP